MYHQNIIAWKLKLQNYSDFTKTAFILLALKLLVILTDVLLNPPTSVTTTIQLFLNQNHSSCFFSLHSIYLIIAARNNNSVERVGLKLSNRKTTTARAYIHISDNSNNVIIKVCGGVSRDLLFRFTLNLRRKTNKNNKIFTSRRRKKNQEEKEF